MSATETTPAPKATDPNQFKLKNVRLSFPHLFEAYAGPAKPGEKPAEPKYSAMFILDKEQHKDLIAQLEARIQVLAETKWDQWKGKKFPQKNSCLKDGSEHEDKEGYSDKVMSLSAREKVRPQVVDQARQPMDKGDPRMYPGVYVNAVVQLWVQDNSYGKKVNANLKAVQYLRTGPALGGSAPVDVNEAFDDESDADDGDIM